VCNQGAKNRKHYPETVPDCHSRDDNGDAMQEFIVNDYRSCNNQADYQ
jgi:hypothetical protein